MQERFKQLLKEKKVTAAQFASLIKVNASAMSHILNGRSKPGFDVLDKIGQAFPDINLNWLICGKGAPYTLSDNTPITCDSTPIVHEEVDEIEPREMPSERVQSSKQIKRIVLFYEDGTFECYEK